MIVSLKIINKWEEIWNNSCYCSGCDPTNFINQMWDACLEQDLHPILIYEKILGEVYPKPKHVIEIKSKITELKFNSTVQTNEVFTLQPYIRDQVDITYSSTNACREISYEQENKRLLHLLKLLNILTGLMKNEVERSI